LETSAGFLRAVFWLNVKENISVALMKVTNKALEIQFLKLVPSIIINTPTSFGNYLFNTSTKTGESASF
jgi:hypothetical protein